MYILIHFYNWNIQYREQMRNSLSCRNVLPLHLGRLLSVCVHTGLLDLWTLCPQRTFHSGSLGGCGMGEVCRAVPQLHIPWCGEITFKFIESIFFFAYLFIFCLFFLYFSKIILCSSKFIKISKVLWTHFYSLGSMFLGREVVISLVVLLEWSQ